ncbi:MAG TPA: DUF2207 domain-containing protein [Candidatus Acidoferrales bacterium]|nr:DUF2207 domain-containing protein [Candidatus Acidoferrales bacterium]
MTTLFTRPSPRRWGFLLLFLIATLALTLPAFARDYRISRFDDRISVMQDGSMRVEEEIHFVFQGSFQGVHRRIPTEYPDPETHSNYTLFLKVISVTDEAGNALKYNEKNVSVRSYRGSARMHELTIYVPGAQDAERTVKIVYTVENGIRYFKDHDELYWNVTGNDWQVPIDASSAIVAFPPMATGLKAQAFTGSFGSRARDAEAQVEGSSVSIESNNVLSAREGLTIDIYIPKGTISEPGTIARLIWWMRSNAVVLLPVWALLVMFGMWWTIGREPDPGMSVAAMYEPPKGFTPAETGALLDDGVRPRDVTSTLIDLAVKGYLKIEETDQKLLIFHHRDYLFHLLKPHNEWGELAPHEREILTNMFGLGEQLISLSSLKNQFYIAMPSVREEIMGALKAKDMYRVDPDTGHGYMVVGALIVLIPFLLLQLSGKVNFFLAPLLAVVSIIITAPIIFLFGRNLSAKSIRGARAKVQVLGFKEFMTRVDGDRLKRMPPDTFEKFLPFAMALGVEEHWAKAFQGVVQDPPSWYVGTQPMGIWNPVLFTNSMSSMSDAAYQAFTAAPQASASGSGFGGGDGGGSSGGGFGGGGGDAF